jgi:Transglycosylase SLT domain
MPVPAVVTSAVEAAKAIKAYKDAGGRLWWLALPAAASVAVPAIGCSALVMLAATTIGSDDDALGAAADATVNVGTLPPAAVAMLPDVQRILGTSCPELPVAWLVAQVEAESAWNERAYSPAGAAGLTQMMRGSWAEAGGSVENWPEAGGPGDTHPVWDPIVHFETAVPWMCTNLRAITQHVAETGKPLTGLQAMAVCHIAGCSRVTGSATGIPQPGEAGCSAPCSADVQNYVTRVTALFETYSAAGPTAAVPTGPLPGPPWPYVGVGLGCVADDPTTTGCLTPAAAHLYAQVEVAFGPWPWGVTCWDAHAWNPSSDHPRGKACDYTVGVIGQHPANRDKAAGWQLASWLTTHAAALRVNYVIWQGQIWQQSTGWRPYTGGGVYDPADATGGHFDHVHVSTTE